MTPYHATPDATFFVGDCRAVLGGLEAESVHAAITSPPYFGLRKYEGVGPSVWGDPGGCEHEWGSIERGKRKDILPEDQTALVSRTGVDDRQNGAATNGGRFCLKCPAWLGMLGLEPDPDSFCAHLVEVFRAVKRVLRRDGLLFVNLGSSMSSGIIDPQEYVLREDLTDDERAYVWSELARTLGKGASPLPDLRAADESPEQEMQGVPNSGNGQTRSLPNADV